MADDLASLSTAELVDRAMAAAAELARRQPPETAAECLESAERLAGALDVAERALAGFIGVVDASGETRRWGLPSTQAWLRSRLGMRDARARERITLARQLARLPKVDMLLATGGLSFGHAATIARAVTRLDGPDCAAAEGILLGLVEQGCPPGKVAATGDRIGEVIAERDGTERPPEAQARGYERSWVSSVRSLDGGRYLKGWLNAEDAAVWDAALGPLAKPAGADDRRDLPERTAAALTAVLSGGHVSGQVTVVMDLDTLNGGHTPARLGDGSPIPAPQARRIALAAGVSALILGRKNVPLYLGRRVRFATAAQRRVLQVLYPVCVVNGCEVPGHLCEVDHVDGWALANGATDIDRLVLCCAWHNRFKHAQPERISIRQTPDGLYTYRLLSPGHRSGKSPGHRSGKNETSGFHVNRNQPNNPDTTRPNTSRSRAHRSTRTTQRPQATDPQNVRSIPPTATGNPQVRKTQLPTQPLTLQRHLCCGS
ncbi:DUF222 domain-containing protein [Actinomadura yumaensis]|uniref:HNH endonuclease signature motif containing protein n=1 Tax=Actinomadura yumaensis TaxID=111807 RepID=UPI003609D874